MSIINMIALNNKLNIYIIIEKLNHGFNVLRHK